MPRPWRCGSGQRELRHDGQPASVRLELLAFGKPRNTQIHPLRPIHTIENRSKFPRANTFTMSGAAQGNTNFNKHKDATTQDAKDDSQPLQPQKPAAQLEEDDEFEDFPVEGRSEGDIQSEDDDLNTRWKTDLGGMTIDWAKEDEVGQQAGNTHLWEESWDDDDTSDDFAVQLK